MHNLYSKKHILISLETQTLKDGKHGIWYHVAQKK